MSSRAVSSEKTSSFPFAIDFSATREAWHRFSHWSARAVCHIQFGFDILSEVVNSVDGLSALVRVATTVSNAYATLVERFPSYFTNIRRFTQTEFDALVNATRIFADPAYFLCGDAAQDIRNDRYLWVVGSLCSTAANIGYFAIWLKDLGRASLCDAIDAISRSAAFRWARVVSATAFMGYLSIGGNVCKGAQRLLDIYQGYRRTFACVDLCSKLSEVALAISELVPVFGPIVPASLGLVSAGIGLVSYFTDIITESEKKEADSAILA